MDYDNYTTNEALLRQVESPLLTEGQREQREQEWAEMLKSYERFGGVRSLGTTYDERAIPYLMEALRSDDVEEITSAIFWLGELGARHSMPTFVDLSGHSDAMVRNLALMGIEQLATRDDVHLIRHILPGLEDSEYPVRLSAIEALGRIASRRTTGELLNMLDGPQSGQTARVVEALGRIGHAGAAPALCRLRNEILGLNFEQEYKGGIRGSDLHPDQMLSGVERALEQIGAHCT